MQIVFLIVISGLLSAVGVVPHGRSSNTQVSRLEAESRVAIEYLAARSETLNLCAEVVMTGMPGYPAYWDT